MTTSCVCCEDEFKCSKCQEVAWCSIIVRDDEGGSDDKDRPTCPASSLTSPHQPTDTPQPGSSLRPPVCTHFQSIWVESSNYLILHGPADSAEEPLVTAAYLLPPGPAGRLCGAPRTLGCDCRASQHPGRSSPLTTCLPGDRPPSALYLALAAHWAPARQAPND